MDVQELKNFFKEHLVPNKLYHIGRGSKSGRLCLRCDKGGFWEVFFGEKRDKVGVMRFATENEACHRMMDEMCKIMEQIYGITWRELA